MRQAEAALRRGLDFVLAQDGPRALEALAQARWLSAESEETLASPALANEARRLRAEADLGAAEALFLLGDIADAVEAARASVAEWSALRVDDGGDASPRFCAASATLGRLLIQGGGSATEAREALSAGLRAVAGPSPPGGPLSSLEEESEGRALYWLARLDLASGDARAAAAGAQRSAEAFARVIEEGGGAGLARDMALANALALEASIQLGAWRTARTALGEAELARETWLSRSAERGGTEMWRRVAWLGMSLAAEDRDAGEARRLLASTRLLEDGALVAALSEEELALAIAGCEAWAATLSDGARALVALLREQAGRRHAAGEDVAPLRARARTCATRLFAGAERDADDALYADAALEELQGAPDAGSPNSLEALDALALRLQARARTGSVVATLAHARVLAARATLLAGVDVLAARAAGEAVLARLRALPPSVPEVERRHLAVRVHAELGRALVDGSPEAALRHLDAALSLGRSLPKDAGLELPFALVRAELGRAALFGRLGRWEEVARSEHEAERLFSWLAPRSARAEIHLGLADLLRRRGERATATAPERASLDFTRALGVLATYGERAGEGVVREASAILRVRRARARAALGELESAIADLEAALETLGALGELAPAAEAARQEAEGMLGELYGS